MIIGFTGVLSDGILGVFRRYQALGGVEGRGLNHVALLRRLHRQ